MATILERKLAAEFGWFPVSGFESAQARSMNTWDHLLDVLHHITLPIVFTRHPETGRRNVGMYRMQKFDGRTFGMHWQLHKVGAEHHRVAEAQGRRVPVAVALGGDPVLTYAATAPVPPQIDELLFAGWLRGRGVELVKCETIDLEVPAGAEIEVLLLG